MNKSTSTIAELEEAADQAEREAMESMRARKDAIAHSQEALKKASKARQKLVRALASQGDGAGNGDA